MTSNTPAQQLLARTPPVATAAATTSSGAAATRPRAVPSQHLRVPSVPLVIHPTFSKTARNAGTVKILVQGAVFYVHADILRFGSSFFDALLGGAWLETSSDAATSFVGGDDGLGMSQRRWSRSRQPLPPRASAASAFGEDYNSSVATPTNISPLATTPTGLLPTTDEDVAESTLLPDLAPTPDVENDAATVATSFIEEMEELGVEVQSSSGNLDEDLVGEQTMYEDYRKKVEARVVLREEKASAFQDLLFFLYPHLDVIIHWVNVAELMTMAQKFDIPLLRRQCITFLMTSAAGKPIMALKVAEDHTLPDLYRESSRYLLDSWSVWEQADLGILSQTTLLKLEKRRTWFLERLLKLGLINTQRDYVCTAACPDPQACARMLEEKWKSAWNSALRYGPPSPSSIYRSLRMLDSSLSSPALHLPHTSCQNHARAWVADLFDRMFSLGVTTQRSFALSAAANRAPFIDTSSTKKYFLFIDLKS